MRRVARLEALAISAASLPDREMRQAASYIAIELHNLWSGFSRSVYLSVMCGTVSAGGRTVVPGVGVCVDDADAIAKAIAFTKSKPGREPHWFEKTTITRLATNFQFGNIGSIAAALAYQTDFFRLAPTFRNFFAHKNKDSFEKINRIRLNEFPLGPRCPGKLLVIPPSATRSPLLIEWIHDVKIMATLAAQ